MWNISPPLATWLPFSLTGQSGQDCLEKVMKEEPSGEVWHEVSFHSSRSCIIDEHTHQFLNKINNVFRAVPVCAYLPV